MTFRGGDNMLMMVMRRYNAEEGPASRRLHICRNRPLKKNKPCARRHALVWRQSRKLVKARCSIVKIAYLGVRGRQDGNMKTVVFEEEELRLKSSFWRAAVHGNVYRAVASASSSMIIGRKWKSYECRLAGESRA